MAYSARVLNRPRKEIHYTVLPRSEIDAYKTIISGDEVKRLREGQEEREKLKQFSEERVRNWPNTIEATRLKKEADRRARMADEEETRKKKDEEDARKQASQRREAIERANLILYEQDDRIKTFNSKMFLSHVLEERQKQLELKDTIKQQEKLREREWEVKLQEQTKQMKEEEERRKQKQKDIAVNVQKEQRVQLDDARRRFKSAREDRRKEGEAIRYAAEKAVLQEIEEEKRSKQRARDLNAEYSRANTELEKIRLEQARKEEEETLKIQRFAQLKEEQMMERKRRADDKFRHDMDKRQKMIDRQAEYLQDIHSQQEQRIHRHMEELEIQQENRAQADRERKKKLWNDIEESRTRQDFMKKAKKAELAEEETAYKARWTETAETLLKDEAQSRALQRDKARKLQEFQKMQVRERDAKRQFEKEQEKVEGHLMKQAVREEEDLFTQYVEGVINEYSTKGLDLNTLRQVRQRHAATL